MGRTILATLDGSGPCERLQVVLVQGDDGLSIGLAEQHYAEGVGWFTQRSIELDPRQWAALKATLGEDRAAGRLGHAAEDRPATLPFPGPAGTRPLRTAVGSE